MLNELHHLAKTLEVCGITPQDWHKDLKPLPKVTAKKPCFKILLNVKGEISNIEVIDDNIVSVLRKWEPSLGNSFPGFNIQPLYRIIDDDAKKELKKWLDGKKPIDTGLLKEWCIDKNLNWDKKFEKKMEKCLVAIPNDLKSKCVNIPAEFNPLLKLCDRAFMMGKGGFEMFFREMKSYIEKTLMMDTSKFLLRILFYEGSSKKAPQEDRGKVSVFMDIPDWEEYPVANKDTIHVMNFCLMKSAITNISSNGKMIEDAFGDKSNGDEDKLPEVKLPILGGVKLRAMNNESPCQYRYKTIDAKSFRIGANSRRLAKGALEWLSADVREGVTWGRVDSREIIFAYPTVLPKSPVKLAACLGAHKADDTAPRFENYAKDVVDCLKGVNPDLNNVELRIFSLRKMDTARTKVVFHRNYTAQRLADAATEWRNGCANVPRIELKFWGEKKGKTVIVSTVTPFPLQIAECLNRFWKLDGTSEREITAIPKSAGIELLLDESVSIRYVPHLLTIAFQNGENLFLSMGKSMHCNEVIKTDAFDKHKQYMPAILGLLLWKLGIRKESYMNNPHYLIGRMLKIADELHAVYCKEVRKNNLPPQLLGNALMVAALDSPTQALSQLALRIAPYLGWARTNSSDSAGLSRFFLKEFGVIEKKLRNTTLPRRLDDSEKAQLLLGYISRDSQTETTNN